MAPAERRRRARWRERDPVEILRRLWEGRWGQPSRGNPLFEGVSLWEHMESLVPQSTATEAEVKDFERVLDLAERGLDPFEGITDEPELDAMLAREVSEAEADW